MEKTTTACCALCQLNNVGDDTTLDEFKAKLKRLTMEMLINKEVDYTYGRGQTAVFVIVSPNEHLLRSNLKTLGFEYKHTFARRVGYPNGDLQMYIKNLTRDDL